ncbi:sulfurtransferase TusA family protein [Methanolobus chelungpuianus]|uniref:sulfurtransferase TusA family protein n=1 Tax=Methanolobus chelungpuianus TaxID=502115 RepID=UPI0021144021|nr:sulfurtransferase TusA family protein [Methanolobus chelungpuianus]
MDKVIDTKGKRSPENFLYANQVLHTLKGGEILKIVVDDPTAVTEVPKGMEADGHEVMNVIQKNETDWEIIIKKHS